MGGVIAHLEGAWVFRLLCLTGPLSGELLAALLCPLPPLPVSASLLPLPLPLPLAAAEEALATVLPPLARFTLTPSLPGRDAEAR